MFTDHVAIKYLCKQKGEQGKDYQILLLQEFNLTIKDMKKKMDNPIVDHLGRIIYKQEKNPVREHFFDEYLFKLDLHTPWYADIVNYFVTGKKLPSHFSYNRKRKLKSESKHYVWESPYIWIIRINQVVRICVAENENESIFSFCHERPCGGHFGPKRTARKILDFGFYWKILVLTLMHIANHVKMSKV